MGPIGGIFALIMIIWLVGSIIKSNTCPVIRILISELDYTKDSDINHLLNQIKSYIAV